MGPAKKLGPAPHGRGMLPRSGRPKGAKTAISRAFEEFSKSTLEDPRMLAAIRQRLMDELAGKNWKPMPCLTLLAAAAVPHGDHRPPPEIACVDPAKPSRGFVSEARVVRRISEANAGTGTYRLTYSLASRPYRSSPWSLARRRDGVNCAPAGTATSRRRSRRESRGRRTGRDGSVRGSGPAGSRSPG